MGICAQRKPCLRLFKGNVWVTHLQSLAFPPLAPPSLWGRTEGVGRGFWNPLVTVAPRGWKKITKKSNFLARVFLQKYVAMVVGQWFGDYYFCLVWCFCLPVFVLPARIVLLFEMIWCEAWNLVDARQKSPRTSELFSEPSLLTLRKSCSQHKPVREDISKVHDIFWILPSRKPTITQQ